MSRIRRLLAVAVAGGLILGSGLAAPAHAQNGDFLDLQVVPVTVSPDPSVGRAMLLYVSGNNAQSAVITIDPAGLGDEATLSPLSTNCGPATANPGETRTLCRLPDPVAFHLPLVLGVRATAKAVVGHVLHLTFTLSADNIASHQVTADIPVGDAAGLVAFTPTAAHGQARVGDHVVAPSYVTNSGSRVVRGIRVTVLSDHSLAPDQFDNCAYSKSLTYEVVCDLSDVVLAPRDRLDLVDDQGKPVGFTVTPDAGAPTAGVDVVYQALADSPAPPNLSSTAPPSHTGHEVRLSKPVPPAAQAPGPPADAHPGDDVAEFVWELSGIHRDIAALATTVTAAVGATVEVNIGVVNKGPAAVDGVFNDTGVGFFFTPPSNSDVTAVPQSCSSIVNDGGPPLQYGLFYYPGAPHGDYYVCGAGNFIPVGATATTKITLKITKATGTKGLVSLHSLYETPNQAYKDDVATDDQADVLVGPSVVGPSTGGNVLTSLPVTGAPLATIAIIGVVILAAGAGLILLSPARRRV
jgi:hypothetical protein